MTIGNVGCDANRIVIRTTKSKYNINVKDAVRRLTTSYKITNVGYGANRII